MTHNWLWLVFNRIFNWFQFRAHTFSPWSTQVRGHLCAPRDRPAHLCHAHWRGAEGDWDSHLWREEEAALAGKGDQEETRHCLNCLKSRPSLWFSWKQWCPRNLNSKILFCVIHTSPAHFMLFPFSRIYNMLKPALWLSNQGNSSGNSFNFMWLETCFAKFWLFIKIRRKSNQQIKQKRIDRILKNIESDSFPLISLIFANNCNFLQTWIRGLTRHFLAQVSE